MTENTVLDQIAERSAATGVVRWHDRRMIAGVARGIGARYDVDPVVVRVAFVITAFLGSLGIAAYLLAWILLPDDRGHVPILSAARERVGASIALVVLATLSVLGFVAGVGDNRGGRFLGLLLLVGIAALIWRRSESRRGPGRAPQTSSEEASVPPGRPSTEAAGSGSGATTYVASGEQPGSDDWRGPVEPVRPGGVAGMPVITPWGGRDGERIATYGAGAHPSAHPVATPAVRASSAPVATATVPVTSPRRRRLRWRGWLLCGGLALGSYTLASRIGRAHGLDQLPAQTLALGVASVAVGLAIVVFGLRGYRTSGLAPTAALLAVLALAGPTAADYIGPDAAMGEASWRPASAAELDRTYEVGAGEGRLDLTQLSATDLAAKTVRAKVGFGELRIVVPADVHVEVRHRVGLGQFSTIDVDGTHVVHDGAGVHGTETLGSGPALVIDLEVGLGEAVVERTRR